MTADAAYVHDVLRCLDAGGSDTESLTESLPSNNAHLHALLVRIRGNEQSAFTELVGEIVRPLELYARRFCTSRESAQDLVQDVFAHLWEQRHDVHVHGSVRAYLYTAVRNRAMNVRRRDAAEAARWTVASDGDRAAGMGSVVENADIILVRQETMARVSAALDTLSPRVREAALLRWNDGLSRAEIAAVMGVALGTVKNHLTVATQTLRTLLADLHEKS
jgi:RNA polymerase sigma-70 factor (ECF subfamily)